MDRAQISRFLESISRGWSVGRACRAAGVHANAPYEHRKVDAEFSEAWRQAYEAGTDRFEDAAADRAINGTRKGIWHQGVLVGTEIRHDNKLLTAVLAARRPAKWRHFEAAEGDTGGAPTVRGEDVLSILEQKLAGLETRSATFALEESSSGGDDA